MFYYVAKIAWFLIQPSSLILVALGLGAILLWTPAAYAGRWLVVLAAAAYLVAGLLPLGNLIILPLEQRFPRTDLASGPPPDGIIVLGGSEDTLVSAARHTTALNEAAERITEAATLAKRFPDARLVFTGGKQRLLYSGETEAAGAANLLTALGVARDRLVLEKEAGDTYENARLTKALIRPGQGERWLLVTSAYHMPRAIGCFRQAGFDVEPWPVDYRTRGWQDAYRLFYKPSQGLRRVDVITREWAGLVVYWLMGRTQTLFPGP